MQVNFLTAPAEGFTGKGGYGLVDGIRGHTDYNINWIGWYGTNPEIELITNNLEFNQLKINFLNNQRHWIFLPKKILIYGFKKKKWNLINEKKIVNLTKDYTVKTSQIEIQDKNFSNFEKIKLIIENQEELPVWRKRKLKKPMVMIDEIELYKK
jgi:hypothetical protein